MLLSEFIERTGITPEHEEWQAINTMYMLADVNKDEFCKLWCKMNTQRVKAAKEQKAKEQEISSALEFLRRISNKLSNIMCKDTHAIFWHCNFALTDKEFLKLSKSLVLLQFNIDIVNCYISTVSTKIEENLCDYYEKLAASRIA